VRSVVLYWEGVSVRYDTHCVWIIYGDVGMD